MAKIDQLDLDQHLLSVEADMAQLGWDLPGYLFGLHHTGTELASELWMEIPGSTSDLLRALSRLRLRASNRVQGLLMVTSSTPVTPSRGLLAVTRDGSTSVALREPGRQPSTAQRLPHALGNHEHLVGLALELLADTA